AAARDNLVNASLMRILDQDRQRFQLHSLVREQARSMASSLTGVQRGHAQALERIFTSWETGWRECRECLQEMIPAIEILWSAREVSRTTSLVDRGSECAKRVGELDVAL